MPSGCIENLWGAFDEVLRTQGFCYSLFVLAYTSLHLECLLEGCSLPKSFFCRPFMSSKLVAGLKKNETVRSASKGVGYLVRFH